MQIQMSGASVTGTAAGYQNAFNERIFRVARNSNTATQTITAASFARGDAAILATATAAATIAGADIVHGATAQAQINNLLIGVVFDYPDTTLGRTGVWKGEDVGLVQCYGYNSAISYSQATKTSVMVAGVLLIPGSLSGFITYAGPVDVSFTVASSVVTAVTGGVGGLVLNMSTVSLASETGITGGFIRCM